MNLAYTRIRNELRAYYCQELDVGVRIEVKNGNLLTLKGILLGIAGTPYEGGTFELDIKVPEEYPYKPPTVKFITKIWHPSVNPFDGTICLEDSDNGVWPVSMTIHKILLTVQSWMTTYNDKEPIDVEILQQAQDNPTLFKKTAQFWTIKFAGAPYLASRECLNKVTLLSKITPSEELAVIALSYHRWALPSDIYEVIARC